MIPLDPQPAPHELPTRFPSPFDRSAVHPLARRAAQAMLDWLDSDAASGWQLHAAGNGKMFGVLVVQSPDGVVGSLRAFSGMLDRRWQVSGWAPPTFDAQMRDAVWIDGDAEMRGLAAERAALERGLAAERATLERELSDGDAVLALRTLDDARSARSRELLSQIQQSYRFTNAAHDVRTLQEIFAPALPPGGAGDCAAPKLLAEAYRRGLRPLALAEVWYGAPPRSGDRRSGSFYPACHGKCGPILAHMLHGLPLDAPPVYGAAAIPASEPAVVHEDAHLLVVNKPSGLLSVPGRGAHLQDCVVSRLRARHPGATGQMVVHRLDLDTSGLLLAAKDQATFVALQRLFSRREVHKRYVACVDGHVRGDQGTIDLPLRTDINDRPRQIFDPVHGKAAVTAWEVLERRAGSTRVALVPHTGRTHQLRVHCAHPAGLDAPILGDRLYGRSAPEHGERLLLHAERLSFVHPVTGALLELRSDAPF